MRISKEGIGTIVVALLVAVVAILLLWWLADLLSLLVGVAVLAVLLLLVVRFFRQPSRECAPRGEAVYAPCDGKVVQIQQVDEDEYFHRPRLQISVFMSVFNVHVNWYPVAGQVVYTKYHKGKYLVAWHPKSSTLNERSTVVVRRAGGSEEVLVRQIAGLVARRIVTYSKPGDVVPQGAQLGFIKFGSRVDIFLPITAKPTVAVGTSVKGCQSVLATW